MRNEIRQALQNHQTLFGENAFANPLSNTSTEPLQILVNIAISEMDAYSRLKNSTSRNMSTDVYNLTRELSKKYYIEENAAKVVIECIAELLGYIPPADIELIQPTALSISVGDIMQFGDYDWRVLDIQNDKALLLSINILEQRAYHPCYTGVTWEQSKLRQYLNDEFFNNFNRADRNKIVETKIGNPDNLWYGTYGGNDTFDKIFILNLEEIDHYFGNSEDYLNKKKKRYDNGKWIADDSGWILSNVHDNNRIAKYNDLDSFWWLRSPGYCDCTVAYVSTPGYIPLNGDRVCIGRGGVRPALWIKL
ncbi:MAG: DUF6273 domain-containing protein [Defluviitaleaceae bacterium]|nr:DUF6273 domain-containing protein [Defluviitaleaceae bacterium]